MFEGEPGFRSSLSRQSGKVYRSLIVAFRSLSRLEIVGKDSVGVGFCVGGRLVCGFGARNFYVQVELSISQRDGPTLPGESAQIP